MTRHFIGLYVLVILAVAGVSWGQERLWLAYGNSPAAQDKALAANIALIGQQLQSMPAAQWQSYIAQLAHPKPSTSGPDLNLELLDVNDIAGKETLAKLDRNEIAIMQGVDESWLLKRLDARTVLALKHTEPTTSRGPLEWALAVLFYAAIALVLMIWLWPLTRDLRALEKATASFGNRNWLFRANIRPRSQVYPLAETFRKMAARIDGLISSHKDMSNAVSHEIKTPLSRMQFEIELAQDTTSIEKVRAHLHNIKADIADLNALVTATLDYAILERADLTLNIAAHDFTKIVPAVADYVQRDVPELTIRCNVPTTATQVLCDAHLMETVLKNLLYNATRYARQDIRVGFASTGDEYQITVEDDGPGIPAADRERVFGSFVQLNQPNGRKTGFGLGLAIVKRAIEWHGGQAIITQSTLGGACFCLTWPQAAQGK